MTAERTTTQRSLVYTLTGLLGLMGLAMAMAFKDPCAEIADPMKRLMCKPTFGDRLPTGMVIASMLGVQLAMVVFYELRQHLRVYGLALVGAGLVGVAGLLLLDGYPIPLVIANGIGGAGLVACAAGIYRGDRAAWSIATAVSAVLAVVFFFASAKIASAFELSLAIGVLPSLAVFLPLTVALGTTPPQAKPA